jgi:prophage tail gpP-like protein
MPDVVLTVGGQNYGGWTGVRIQRGIEQVCGQFSLSLTERWRGQDTPWPIAPGDACAVSVDGHPVITGYVDDVLPQFDAGSHQVQVAGRDATGDLVDCSAENAPGRWEHRTLLQIVAEICRPFGVAVAAVVDVGARFRSFAIQPGESAFEAIDRACRFRGVLPVADGAGGLLLTGPGPARAPVRIVQGANILSGYGFFSWRDRYGSYTVKGCDSGFDDSTPDQNASPVGVADDPNVSRYRPLVLVAEGPADTAKLKQRAIWEAAVRRGRSRRASISVAGWGHAGGVWAPNTLVSVASQWLGIDGDMLIASVTLTHDEAGTRAELEVCSKEAFAAIAIAEEEETAGWSA